MVAEQTKFLSEVVGVGTSSVTGDKFIMLDCGHLLPANSLPGKVVMCEECWINSQTSSDPALRFGRDQ